MMENDKKALDSIPTIYPAFLYMLHDLFEPESQIRTSLMGQKSSKRLPAGENSREKIYKQPKKSTFKFWKPFTGNKLTADDGVDENNNNTVIVLHRKVTPPETNRSFTPFSFIQCALSRLLTTSTRRPKNLSTSDTPGREILISTSISKGIRSTPILRPTSKSNHDVLRKDNVFARPMTPEVVNVRHLAMSVTAFPVIIPPQSDIRNESKSPISITHSIPHTINSSTSATPAKSDNFVSSQLTVNSSSSATRRSNPVADSKKRGPNSMSNRQIARNREPFKSGCCTGRIAPPAYLDYRSASHVTNRYGGGAGRGTGNPIIDRLKNVDVVEELQYFVPGETAGDCNETNPEEDFEYYYVCNDCGEMEPCSPQKDGKKSECKSGKPVTYSRRQRFNFMNRNSGVVDDSDDDGPPFKWSGDSACCCCPCCVAGLRRNPNCECKCCQDKGKLRVVNSFDEIPVGKNPEPKPKKECICNEEDEAERECEELMPKESGVYFYDADQKRFIRQVPRTPTPLIIERPQPPQSVVQEQELDTSCCPDMINVIQCLPPRRQGQQIQLAPPEPIILPPICGGVNDMRAILANVELSMRGGINQLMNTGPQVAPASNVGSQPYGSGSKAYPAKSYKQNSSQVGSKPNAEPNSNSGAKTSPLVSEEPENQAPEDSKEHSSKSASLPPINSDENDEGAEGDEEEGGGEESPAKAASHDGSSSTAQSSL